MPRRIAIAGATGALGSQLLAALDEKDHPADELRLFASERSEGEEVDYGGETLPVEPADFRGLDVVLVATPLAAARGIIDAATKAGLWVLDFSGANRSDQSVPLVAPGVSELPKGPGRVMTVAGPAGLALATLLKPLGAQWVDVVALYGAAFRGNAGVRLLERQTAELMGGREGDSVEPFAHRLAFNVIPQVGAFAKEGHHPFSTEELAVALDVARALPKGPVLRATAMHVPMFHGITLAVSGQLNEPLDVSAALKSAAHVKVLDTPGEAIYPMPMLASSDRAVHVGRIRSAGNHFWLVAAVDNAGFTARAGVELALALP
jgi:aspartate-semialdehyde dehydrogenase